MTMYIYDYRELIKNLVASDLKLKYASSVLGFAWSLINPLLMMLVLFFVFKNVFAPSNASPEDYALNLLIGIFAWRFFAMGTAAAMYSVVGKPSLVTKIFIPRHILTFSNVVTSLISSLLEFIVLVVIILALKHNLSLTIVMFPFIHILFFLVIYGIGLILSSLYVYFRDLNQIWDVVLQIGFFLSPIVYPLSMIPEKYLSYYMLNPVTRLIDMYRDIFLYGVFPGLFDIIIVLVLGIVLVILGTLLFNRLSLKFAEEV
jgi:lipopolysaccharide transport system permease protein